jgi:cellulose synthase/poly-beta-1,6-N-acetylglucosamine synthase-like glycosyltransferase
MTALAVVLAALAVPALACSGYLLALTLLSWRNRLPQAGPPRLRFDLIVPAHDEQDGIAETVKSLLAIDHPRDLFRVVVVADNCTDATAERARAAGAEVLVRDDLANRGKGQALAYAFERSLAGAADAVVVVDADTLVSANLLRAFSARLEAGARAVQADYAVRNAGDSWRTRLMAIAFAAFHEVRSRGRERLSLSCGLRGNGMCFSRALLGEVPHHSYSLVEDVEYGLRVGEAGHRVVYAGEAHVWGQMVSSEKASRSQRRRWEQGRSEMVRKHGLRLLKLALQRRDRVLFDLFVDVVLPPLSWIAALSVGGLCATLAVRLYSGHPGAPVWPWAASVLFLTLYVLRGWALSGTGARGLSTLLLAPFYVAWKLLVMLRRPARRSGEWVRTTREGAPR